MTEKIPRLEVLARAKSALGRRTTYVMGAGGRNPGAELPSMRVVHEEGMVDGCDCSGFVAWCLGVDRYLPAWMPHYENGDWFETTAVFRDARAPWGFVADVPWQAAQIADVLVWGDRKGTDGKHHQGHIGLVSEVDDKGPLSVIHCSLGEYRKTGDAIAETDCGIFARNGAIVAMCEWVTA